MPKYISSRNQGQFGHYAVNKLPFSYTGMSVLKSPAFLLYNIIPSYALHELYKSKLLNCVTHYTVVELCENVT